MSNEQIIKTLRQYMKEYELTHPVRCALSWCIAKLYKEIDREKELD